MPPRKGHPSLSYPQNSVVSPIPTSPFHIPPISRSGCRRGLLSVATSPVLSQSSLALACMLEHSWNVWDMCSVMYLYDQCVSSYVV